MKQLIASHVGEYITSALCHLSVFTLHANRNLKQKCYKERFLVATEQKYSWSRAAAEYRDEACTVSNRCQFGAKWPRANC